MTDEELSAGTAAGRILLGGDDMRLISAKLIRPRIERLCPTCDKPMPVGELCWSESWIDDGKRSTEYLHVRCDIPNEEPRLEYRNFLVHHLTEDGMIGKLRWADAEALS